jgi:hypothetical protein
VAGSLSRVNARSPVSVWPFALYARELLTIDDQAPGV